MANFRATGPLGFARPVTLRHQLPHGPPVSHSQRKLVRVDWPTQDIRFYGSIDDLKDGDIRRFDVSEYAAFFTTDKRVRRISRAPRRSNYPVIFVNGMQGSPVKFRAQACAVSALSGGPVLSVYNGSGTSFLLGDNAGRAKTAGDKPGNILTDLVECLTDKLQSTDWDQLTTWLKRKRGVPQQQLESEMTHNLSRFNRAAGSLYALLLQPGFEHARIVAHSQGNIITCNAVNALAATRGNKAISGMKIYAVASPVVFWSEAGMFGQDIVSIHALANDLVAWLGANVSDLPYLVLRRPVDRESESMEGTEVSERYAWTPNLFHLLTHNFYAYLEKMWKELRDEFE
jgi:hypothetical protein